MITLSKKCQDDGFLRKLYLFLLLFKGGTGSFFLGGLKRLNHLDALPNPSGFNQWKLVRPTEQCKKGHRVL